MLLGIMGAILVLLNSVTLTTPNSETQFQWILESNYRQASEDAKKLFPDYIQCGLSENEFEFLCSVVSAEAGDNVSGQYAVACVIFNRVDSPLFPDSITEVLTESGQFSTVRDNRCNGVVTEEICQVVLSAYFQRSLPKNVLYFRCDYYFDFGTPYQEIGGNYFTSI